jgi:hypothetical protein
MQLSRKKRRIDARGSDDANVKRCFLLQYSLCTSTGFVFVEEKNRRSFRDGKIDASSA